MSDPHEFEHFVSAQATVYPQVIRELSAGRKESHWMWFIFPQLSGLGQSAMSRRFALESAAAAHRYLQHPLLGARLRECTRIVLDLEQPTAYGIFGATDCRKFRSCLTLFVASCPGDDLFERALQKYFEGKQDPLTRKLLERGSGSDRSAQ